jgi:class 3 adenylate cyclase/tetratricopeptide (TPR) repeat protein
MPSSPQWVFGPFRLDPANACLWHGVAAVVLPPKAFDVLHYLVTHPDRLVPKDELLDAVWPETVVTDAVLRVAIGALRKVLGDPAQTPRFIATVPRRGYRFVAPVTEYTGAAPGPAAPVPPAPLQTPMEESQGASTAPLPATLAAPTRPRIVPLSGDLPPPEAERRHLTVLFCDLVDATTLAGHLDPEDYREIVRAYHQTCVEVLQRFDGYLAQYLGDGVLVYFGYPMAHEDDAQRAVRTGLGLLDAIEPLNTRLALPPGERVAVRLGVHTGLVVVGDVGVGARQEPLALGETPNIAARLQALAAPNTLVISAATYQLIAGYFTCEAFGEQSLRGLAQPLRVYRVLGISGVQSRFEVAVARGLTPLVGREPEVALLVERWARVKAGMGQVVVLAGEAGIGKSRLVQVLKEHIASEAHTCLESRGLSYYQHSAFYPIIELLQHWLPWQPGAAPDAALERLEALLAQAPLALAEAVPLVAALIALPLPAERYPPRTLPPEQQRQRTFAAVLTLVGALAAQQPVLLIVEDLHWVDPSTLELLTLLLDQAPTLRLYLVLTCRPTLQPPWGFRAHLTPMTLAPLTRPHVEAMVQGMLRGHHLPAAVLEQIRAQTDGNPLFVEEVTKAVVEAGLSTGSPAQDAGSGPLPGLAIPATLHEALMARLDRLGSAKGVAQLGATLGRQFPYTLLRAVAPLDDAPLQRDLATLVAAELLYQRGQPPQAVYTFKHALIQEVAYESVLRHVRRQTHQRLVAALEAQFPDTVATTPELLAYQALRGEQWEKAVPYCQQAGARAYDRAAFREAAAAFEQALQALAHLPEDGDTGRLAIDLRLALGGTLFILGEYKRQLALLGEAETLARALDDQTRLGGVLAIMARVLRLTGDHDGAIAASQQALELAAALGDSTLQVRAAHTLGQAYYAIGDFGRAAELLRRNVEAADRQSGTPSTIFRIESRAYLALTLFRIESRAYLALTLSALGAFAEGRRHGEEALRLARLEGRGPMTIYAHSWLGSLYLAQGDLEHAIQVLEPGLALCRASGNRNQLRQIAAALGYAAALQGRLAEGRALLEEAISESVRTGGLQGQAYWVAWRSEVCRLAGRGEEAGQYARQALDLARQLKERGHEALALHQLGVVQAHADPPDTEEAEAHYQQALTLAEELGMRPLQAHCHHGLGRLYGQTGRSEQARAALATAIDLYRAMDMTFWLPQAEAALAQVEQ